MGRGFRGTFTPSLAPEATPGLDFLTQAKAKLVNWAGGTKFPQQLPENFFLPREKEIGVRKGLELFLPSLQGLKGWASDASVWKFPSGPCLTR